MLLGNLSAPIYHVVVPIGTLTKATIVAELQSTNVQPLVLIGIEAKHSAMLAGVAEAALSLPRTLILSGRDDVPLPPQVRRITSRLTDDVRNLHDLMALPWEQLGAAVVRKYMRNDWTL